MDVLDEKYLRFLGERIRKRREELHLTQEYCADKLGYKNKSSIGKIESGLNDLPQSKLAAFAVLLHTTPEYLMGWRDDPANYIEIVANNGWTVPDNFVPNVTDQFERARLYCIYRGNEMMDSIRSGKEYFGDWPIDEDRAEMNSLVVAFKSADDRIKKAVLTLLGLDDNFNRTNY